LDFINILAKKNHIKTHEFFILVFHKINTHQFLQFLCQLGHEIPTVYLPVFHDQFSTKFLPDCDQYAT